MLRAFKYLSFDDTVGRRINLDEYEVDEQRLIFEHLPRDACVLELGARHGVISAAIGRVLADPQAHVAVEPDQTVLSSLLRNKAAHGSMYTVLPGIIAPPGTPFAKIRLDSLCTHVVKAPVDSRYLVEVPTYTWEQAEALAGRPFTAVVADIEGSFGDFVRDHARHLQASAVRFVFFEKDAPQRCDYARVVQELAAMGFEIVVDGFHCIMRRAS